jgi:hypothetical protein
MRDAGIGGWWIEGGLIGLAGTHGICHGIIDFEDHPIGAVLAVFLFILALDEGGNVYWKLFAFLSSGFA